mgnify:CR=1 FL=1
MNHVPLYKNLTVEQVKGECFWGGVCVCGGCLRGWVAGQVQRTGVWWGVGGGGQRASAGCRFGCCSWHPGLQGWAYVVRSTPPAQPSRPPAPSTAPLQAPVPLPAACFSSTPPPALPLVLLFI